MAKGIASGFPISGIAANQSIMSKAWPGSQGGTYCGNAVAAAAGAETIRVIKDEHLVHNAAERGEQLAALLDPLEQQYRNVGQARGVGLMRSIEFVDDNGVPAPSLARKVQLAAEEHNLLTLTCSPYNNVVRVVPALNVSAQEIDEGAARLSAAVQEVLG
jgi:4-aminobutyrate aminotransferase